MPNPMGHDISCGYYTAGTATVSQTNAPDLTEYSVERFEYDPVGNLLALVYSGSQTWTREFGMDGCSREDWTQAQTNRLTSLKVGPDNMTYQYDANGNLVQENANKHLEWDYADRMVGFADQAGSQASVDVRYLYDAAGQRVKKWSQDSGSGNVESTTYIDTIYEAHAWVENQKTHENTYLHVMDNQQRVAMVHSGDIYPKEAGPSVQYTLGDHLGSSQVVIDSTGSWINREEYTAFGETSFGGFARKRYRYTGKERDEESGYYYHGARYYAPWLCRWTSTDPAGMKDGVNGYGYVGNNPVHFIDASGGETGVFVLESQSKKIMRDLKPVINPKARAAVKDTPTDVKFNGQPLRQVTLDENKLKGNILILKADEKGLIKVGQLTFDLKDDSQSKLGQGITRFAPELVNLLPISREKKEQNSSGIEGWTIAIYRDAVVDKDTIILYKIYRDNVSGKMSMDFDSVDIKTPAIAKREGSVVLAHELYLHAIPANKGESCIHTDDNFSTAYPSITLQREKEVEEQARRNYQLPDRPSEPVSKKADVKEYYYNNACNIVLPVMCQ